MPPEVAVPVLCVSLVGPLALIKGAEPEKIGALLMLAWFVFDQIYHLGWGPTEFRRVDWVHFALDSGGFLAFALLGLKANRMWPLLAAGGLVIGVVGHLVMATGIPGQRRAYWVMTQIPPLMMIFALLFGTLAHMRRRRRIGPYRDWRRPGAR